MKNENKTNLKFFIYARKSTDRGDNQIESLPDQIKFLTRLAKEKNLTVIDIIQEAKSAKKPYIRPHFAEMIARIQNGEAEGIICWKLDRLARNPVDGGTISWLLQEGTIKRIVTPEKDYKPEDNVLMMSVEMGMANQYVKDLSTNISRSVISKFERGEFPSTAPLGYLNIRESKKKAHIEKDPSRFEMVKKMWGLMLTGSYNPRQICDIANNDWGLRTRARGQKFPERKLTYSNTYRMFTNIFYAGRLEYKGEQYKANHEAMVTLEQFDHIQKLLGSKGKPRSQTKEFPFTGIIKCKECGCTITAESKQKMIKSTGELKTYVYYHCTHRKRDYDCSQRKNLLVSKLEEQILADLGITQVYSEFYEYAVKRLKKENEKHFQEKTLVNSSFLRIIEKCDDKLKGLLDTKIEGLISSEEYTTKKEEINRERAIAQEKLDNAEGKIADWTDTLERAVDYVMWAKINFEQGTDQERREILKTLGQNLTMENGILNVGDRFWREPFAKMMAQIKQKTARLEPAISCSQTGKEVFNQSLNTLWWTRADSNR